MAHLTVVADSHLSVEAPEAVANWEAVLDYVEGTAPDLVVHVGDVSLRGETETADLAFARAQLDRLAAPFAVVPGNHDIGDIATASHDPEDLVNGPRRAHWVDAMGEDHWAVDVGGWTVLGVNAQLFGSGLPSEEGQWDWLETQLRDRPASRHCALVVHKPVAASAEEQASAPSYRFIPADAQSRLAALTKEVPLDVVFSGHVHQSRQLTYGGTLHAWAPTSWAVLPESMQATIGSRRCGLFDVILEDDGGMTVDLLEPPGMTQLTVGQNAPFRYTH